MHMCFCAFMSDIAHDDMRDWLEGIKRLHGISVSEIARRSGVSESTLTRFMQKKTNTLRLATTGEIERVFKIPAPAGAKTKVRGVHEEPPPPFELELDEALVTEARGLQIDVEEISRRAIIAAVRDARMRQWAEENRAVFEAKARLIEEQGLWSDGLRQF